MSSTCCSMRVELGVDEGELALGVGALREALLEDVDLPAEAAAQLVGQRRVGLLALERRHAPAQVGDVARFADDLPDGAARDQEPQEHPRQTAQAVGLGFEAAGHGRGGRAVQLQVDDRAAALRQQVVDAAVAGIEAAEERLDPLVPVGRGLDERHGRDQPLKALVGGERQQIAELEPGAEHPEAGFHQAEQAERAEADPVRRDEHAERPGVEGRRDVVEEAGLSAILNQCRGSMPGYFTSPPLSGPRGPG